MWGGGARTVIGGPVRGDSSNLSVYVFERYLQTRIYKPVTRTRVGLVWNTKQTTLPCTIQCELGRFPGNMVRSRATIFFFFCLLALALRFQDWRRLTSSTETSDRIVHETLKATRAIGRIAKYSVRGLGIYRLFCPLSFSIPFNTISWPAYNGRNL